MFYSYECIWINIWRSHWSWFLKLTFITIWGIMLGMAMLILCYGSSIKRKQSTKGNYSKYLLCLSYGPCALQFLFSRSFNIWSFISIAVVDQELLSRQSLKESLNQQWAITQKILMLELWTMCTVLTLLMFFPYMKFHKQK